MDALIAKLKNEIIEVLNLSEMTPESIDENEPLFVEGLGLDSIDALELIVLLERNYGLKLATAEEGKTVLKSVRSMAEFIRKNNKGNHSLLCRTGFLSLEWVSSLP
jgi:acyl carrier protein